MSNSTTSHEARAEFLGEIYEYVVVERNIAPEALSLGHVIELLREEGVFFWRDHRFLESQRVAIGMIGGVLDESQGVSLKDQLVVAQKQVDFAGFVEFVSPLARLFLRAFSEELVIPDFPTFVADLTYHFYKVQDKTGGMNAQYIPILRDADPERWGLSVCSIDGQRFSMGDYDAPFSIQSVSKPVTYGLCIQAEGEEEVDRWIGVEPAGRPFNTQDLDVDTQCPFNASVNSGAIMAAGLFASAFPEATWEGCVQKIRQTWEDLSGNDLDVGFSRETFESEKATAYNNFAIAYNLKGRRGLPHDVDLQKMLDVYLGCCSIEMTAEALAVAAATLANGGICPITNKEVFPADVVRHVLSETMTCGMYDQAGRFAVEVGVPAKSGVAGALMIIVPNIFGIATFSPRLNKQGNSVRGLEFCKGLVGSYRVHIFEPLRSSNCGAKIDPRENGLKDEKFSISQFVWAYQAGDVWAGRLRNIFVYTLVQSAAASDEGLSDRKRQSICENYELIYQSQLDDASLNEAVALVASDPHDMRALKALRGNGIVPDSFRTVILSSVVDVIMADGQVSPSERGFAVAILTFYGMNESVALMEVDRMENQIGHRFRLVEPCEADCEAKISLGSDSAVDPRLLETAARAKSAKDDVSEVVLLRREVYRLQKRVANLTHMLHDSRHERTHRLSLRKSVSSSMVAQLQEAIDE